MVEIDWEMLETGSVKSMEKLKDLLLNLLRLRHGLLKTEIVKLCFLVDYAFTQRKKRNASFSTVTYIKYHFGPYADAIGNALQELEEDGKISQSLYGRGYLHDIISETPVKIFSKEVQELIDQVMEKTDEKTLSQIKKIVYELPEVKEQKFNKKIILYK